ncbi:MAG: toll/interleukin-1 receptor domain-containing protein [Anaerolineales bacterium]|nr:toll/interleukin-1 receptor domain-containing protein [Anaerolineales bacterium]
MGHIFISYSHKDKDYVHRLADFLQAEGFEVWIDDRIDYGTRWPLVIEDAIDSCECFILVASKNAHESEWVQHELARAQRLQKRIFPLLLEGSPWLSFESIQYFDVRGENLPNKKFLNALNRVEKERFEYFRHVASEYWPVYQNDDYRFSVRYPGEGDFVEIPPDLVQVNLPVLRGTDFDERTLTVHFRNNGNLSSQLIEGLPLINQSRYVDILGLKFLRESGSEGGMSRWHELVSYSTARDSKVVTISFHLATYAVEVFGLGPGQIVEVDREAAKDIILYVVSSFMWLD